MVPPPQRAEEWREGGGSCAPPMGEPSINLVVEYEYDGIRHQGPLYALPCQYAGCGINHVRDDRFPILRKEPCESGSVMTKRRRLLLVITSHAHASLCRVAGFNRCFFENSRAIASTRAPPGLFRWLP